jgi:hypothetical protein
VFACDLIVARDGLDPVEMQSVQRFFGKLAAAVRIQHEAGNDAETEPAGSYVKSWDDALFVALGLFLDWPQAIDYARDAPSNPYSFTHQLEHAITADGRVADEYRGEEKEHYRVTYPLYHLQGLALCAELLRHRGENHFRDLNSKGAGLLRAYEHYLPFVAGSNLVTWPDDETRIHYGITKFAPALTAYRMSSTYDVLFQREPLWDPHLLKKAASLVGRLPASLVCADHTAPEAPQNVHLGEAWATGILLAWEAPSFADEGDLVLRYQIYRNGQFVGTTAQTMFVDRSLEPETGYRYEVRAIDRAENASVVASRTYYTTALP